MVMVLRFPVSPKWDGGLLQVSHLMLTDRAGGNVEGNGAEQAKLVRMTFADGFVLVDTVDNGIVLFFEPRGMAFPADVEILDAKGSMLASYREFDQVPFVA
jgi:hypothetical protein